MEDVKIERNRLFFSKVALQHEGIYRCEAMIELVNERDLVCRTMTYNLTVTEQTKNLAHANSKPFYYWSNVNTQILLVHIRSHNL